MQAFLRASKRAIEKSSKFGDDLLSKLKFLNKVCLLKSRGFLDQVSGLAKMFKSLRGFYAHPRAFDFAGIPNHAFEGVQETTAEVHN